MLKKLKFWFKWHFPSLCRDEKERNNILAAKEMQKIQAIFRLMRLFGPVPGDKDFYEKVIKPTLKDN